MAEETGTVIYCPGIIHGNVKPQTGKDAPCMILLVRPWSFFFFFAPTLWGTADSIHGNKRSPDTRERCHTTELDANQFIFKLHEFSSNVK